MNRCPICAMEYEPNTIEQCSNCGFDVNWKVKREQERIKQDQQEIADMTKIIERQNQDESTLVSAYKFRIRAYRNLQQYHEVIADYSKIIEITNNIFHRLDRIHFCEKVGRYEEAIADYTIIIENLSPNSTIRNYYSYFYGRAYNYEKLGRYDEAIADYAKAIKIESKYALAHNRRGIVYYKLGDYQEAINNYINTTEIVPQYAPAYFNRGCAYDKMIKYHEAIANYTKAIEIDPLCRGYLLSKTILCDIILKDNQEVLDLLDDL
ncbi:tetratricopeptide repeat protein [Cyanobacterium stanieri LEGE 03274]|uniref:Tetratricopeptide repeat protein n=1 Tax=Cyanobacterium stanieri LEGE 03274 TaxID=1828756 RepID=A0ABR9V408_9CHRO|nr:tetratricopeptide repeat protein [Cyanobacterium stanieri]MBE9222625.1 tetratricopeptide repeat protein [Cyanobacterium stanieri LEGE 03274]